MATTKLISEVKRCTACGVEKPLSEFNRRKNRPIGVVSKCKACCTEAHRNYMKAHPELDRKYNLKRQFGLTIEEWEAKFEEQAGCCAVCGVHQSETRRRLDVDHNHETGQVRSLLCEDCNRMVGLSHEHPDVLRKAAAYIEQHQSLAVVVPLAQPTKKEG